MNRAKKARSSKVKLTFDKYNAIIFVYEKAIVANVKNKFFSQN
jgi:hypothetical protein